MPKALPYGPTTLGDLPFPGGLPHRRVGKPNSGMPPTDLWKTRALSESGQTFREEMAGLLQEEKGGQLWSCLQGGAT